MTDLKRPKTHNSASERELDRAQEQFDAFDANIKDLTLDRMNEAPKLELEPQTKLSQQELSHKKDIYLKPKKSIGCREKFNEKFRADYEFQKEYVHFIFEHKEIIGDSIDMWTRPFPGMPAEEWEIPANTPVWGPRYLAEQISRKFYHRLVMKQATTGGDGMGQYYGQMAADTTVPRLEAKPVSTRKSIFMGSNQF